MMEPNLKNLYERGNKWCGKCGELRKPNEKNRCGDCGSVLRSHSH